MTQPITLKELKHSRNKHDIYSNTNYQIIYILQGKGEVRIGDEKGEFKEKSVVYIPPNINYSIDSNQQLNLLSLIFNYDYIEEINKKIIDDYVFNAGFILTHEQYNTNIFKVYLKRLMASKIINRENYFYRLNIYLGEMLLDIIDKKSQFEFENANELRSYLIKKYIDDNYYLIDNMNALSTSFNLSTRYITKIFKEKYHITPNEYLIKTKIDESKDLLKETDYDVLTICFRVGFNSVSNYYRHFRKLEDLSPNKYRHIFQML